MRPLALILCLIWGAFAALMPQPSQAAGHEMGAMMASAAAPAAMAAPMDCPGCPDQHENGAPACGAAGAICGVHAGCTLPIAFAATGGGAFPSLRSAMIASPPMALRTAPQRALVPEPPPPRA